MTDPTDPADPHAIPPKELPPDAVAEAAAENEGMPPIEPADEAAADSTAPVRTRRDPLPVLLGIGVLVLIGAVVFLWRHPLNLASFSSQPAPQQQAAATPPPQVPGDTPAPAADTTQTAPTQTAPTAEKAPQPPTNTASAVPVPVPAPAPAPPPVQAASEPAPAPAPVPAPVVAKADVPAASAKPDQPPPDQHMASADQLNALQQQVDKLQQKLDELAQHQPAPPDLGPLEQRLTALEHRPAPPPPPDLAPALAALGSKLDGVAARQDQITGQQASGQAALAGRLDAAEARLGAMGKQTSELAGLSDRAARLARLQAASSALAAGRPVGDLPDAPPALAQFRTVAPPTEAALRLAFPAAAQAAANAAEPDTGALPFWQAVQNRAESLVTVRRGDHVVVGDPAAGVIARARVALDAGDLAGAVAATSTLTGPPAAAMASWTSQARALVDARAALAALAARA